MNSRRLCAALALPAAIALAACTSSTSGTGSTSGTRTVPDTTSTGSTPAGSSTAASGSKATNAAALGRLMQSAVTKVTSAHISLNANAASQVITGAGSEQLAKGKLVAMDLTENLPGGAGSIRVIIVNGKTYAKLPASLNPTGKPYLLVSANSSNAVIKELAASVDAALSSASLSSVSDFVNAAKSVRRVGTFTIDGVHTTHYAVVVDVAKLPSSVPGKDALTAGGVTTVPLDLYLDDQGRPVQVLENLQVSGQAVSTKVKISDYNKPVSIKAPPASQVGTS